jgi:hypothetical protein
VLFCDDDISNRSTVDPVRASVEKKSKMPLKKNPKCHVRCRSTAVLTATTYLVVWTPPLVPFPQLKKYSHRWSEPVAAPTFDDVEEESEADEDKDDEEQVDEEKFLATRPKPVGFDAGKMYATDIEEQLVST